ncbi:HD domain-containing phosphohydrolase [Halobacteriovorax sp. HLS]|uniref:HD domain-containing phosphohydrolase n=1 Tax=Halobacteriovorax sp. HLS TaxID=2234000 RepID=UPI000FD8D628|nr:HD domain-containing phosphohydrolase [Halobacteriovorax sp. HLS]
MSQALIISDNEVLNDLYSVNLEVYTGTNVTVKRNCDEAIKLLELNPNFDVIISLCMLSDIDSGSIIYQHLVENDIDSPLIVVGKKSDVPKDVPQVVGCYDIKNLIRNVAKVLEISAKDMVDKAVPDYYPVPIKLFYNVQKVPCDIFLKLKKSMTDIEYPKIFSKGDSPSVGIKKYLDEGVHFLYVDSTMRLEIINLASACILTELNALGDPGVTDEKKIEVIEQGIEIVADKLFTENEVNEEIIELSKSCMSSVKDVVENNPKLKNILKLLTANRASYLYSHSIIATYVATHIVKTISWGGESHIDKINFVFFFHDLYLAPIYSKYPELKYEEEALFNSKLEDSEKEVILNHAKLAADALANYPRLPLGADQIILQHHGMTSGQGFAVNFKDDISPLAKVMIIAEGFTEELLRTLEDTTAEKLTKPEIIKALHIKFPRHTYKKIIETLNELKF